MHFTKIVKDFQPLTFFAKLSILDVWQGSECASRAYREILQVSCTVNPSSVVLKEISEPLLKT